MILNPEHRAQLSALKEKPAGYRSRALAALRRIYKDDPAALQQIDMFDPDSPFSTHVCAYRAAQREDRRRDAEQELKWLRVHYPHKTIGA